MKKQVLLGSVLLAAISAFSQSGHKPKPNGLINTRLITDAKYFANENTGPLASSSSAQPAANAAAKTSAYTWHNFTASMNVLTSVISYCKPLQWNDELNAVTFMHRKSPSYPTTGSTPNTESGSIVAMISTNCGTTWDSTLMYADPVNRGRYPQGALYNPPGNTDINNAYLVVNGPVTHGTGWVGNYYASKQAGTANYNSNLSSVPNAQQYFSASGPFPPNLGHHDFACYSFSSTDDGKVRALGTIAADINNTTASGDSAVMVVTGTFNNGVFDWAGTVIDPPSVKGSDGERQHVSRPMMAWNEAGNIGYVVVIGSRMGATGANVGFQPIVYKTVNSGATWSLENSIDFNSPAFMDVRRSIRSVNTDTTLQVPFFNWIEAMDITVDANNKLHLFSTIIGSASNHLDSTGYISSYGTEGYRWPHEPGYRPYLYDFIYDGTNASPSWSHLTVDSMSTEGPAGASTGNGYQDNPWPADPANNNSKSRVDARLQMSRTPDGKYIVYTWGESDTTFTTDQKKWNNMPNVKARILNVTTGLIDEHELNVTIGGGGDVANRAWWHFVSPKCKFISDANNGAIIGPIVSMPITVTNSDPYGQTTPNTHWYACANLEFTKAGPPPADVSVAENSLNSVNNSNVFPNPAKNNATLRMSLVSTSKVQIEVMNAVGQVVKTANTQGQVGVNNINVDLSGLASGIYFVNVKVDNASSTKKLVVE